MKIRHNCLLYLPTIVLFYTIWDSKCVMAAKDSSASTVTSNSNNNNNNRKKTDSSILEIMNTHEIEKMLSTQIQNDSENPYLIESELNDDYTDLTTINYRQANKNNKNQQKRLKINQRNDDFSYNNPNSGIAQDGNVRMNSDDINDNRNMKNNNRKKSRNNAREAFDLLMPYNETIPYSTGLDSTILSSDITSHDPSIYGANILKSSKNALYITKKEYLKKDWCKTEPLIQRIREPGCLTRTFVNRFCYGQCNSFYIPKSPKRRRNNGGRTRRGEIISAEHFPNHFEDEDLTGHQFQSCGFCKPKKFTWITITLRCPSQVPQLKKKRIQRIKQCKCMAIPLD